MRRGDAFDLLGIAKFIKTTQLIRDRVAQEVSLESNAPERIPSDLDDEGAASRLLEVIVGEDGILQPTAAHTSFSTLGHKIESTIDEEALQKRTTLAEKKAGIAEILGATQADRAISEEEGEDRMEGVWGKDQDWVIRPR